MSEGRRRSFPALTLAAALLRSQPASASSRRINEFITAPDCN